MLGFVRKHAAVVLAAVLGAGFTAGAPAIAALMNADKLDGRDGVACSATKERRSGAYVATCPSGPNAGLLPGNIIRKVRNAGRLDGIDSPAFALESEVPGLIANSDGSGSGLDADLLDGRDASDFDADAKGKSEDPAGGDLGLTTTFQDVIDLSIGTDNRLVVTHPSLIMGTASLNLYTGSATASEVQCRMLVTPDNGAPEVISQIAQAKFPASSAWDLQVHVTGSALRDAGTYDLSIECRASVGDLKYARGDLIGTAI